MAILVIVNLWVEVFLNCVSTLDQDIASILVKSITDLFSYYVVGTKPHNNGILNLPNHIGWNIRRHADERDGKLE